ncbi:cell division protein FtsQ/DivIB [Sediminibacillus halophilus]|uniref:Cell division protein DivIB n=1 Tax=Sediminibacillus halophilus TaxID=482461 RepID=A0A1G9MR81_9BACI|nr:cell division protein FtsQ/DivIB [Sediminibacillus halophilus]SDL76760.1 cell division protein FtsQ [Sediminibacillus halophilus]
MSRKKVVSIEDRIPKLKQARKKKANRRLIFYLSIFFVLISIVVYLQSPLSQVRHVLINGNQYIDSQEVKTLSGLSTKDNFWNVDKQAVSDKIQEHPVIRKAEVERRFPTTIQIEIKEYNRVGYVMEDGAYYPVLENGKSLKQEKMKIAKGDAPLLSGFTKETYLQEMTKELQRLPTSIVRLISEINWEPTEENPYKITLFMNDGYEVEGTIRNFSAKMKAYPSIVAQLEPGSEGIIHIGVGAYFESYQQEEDQEDQVTEEGDQDEAEG